MWPTGAPFRHSATPFPVRMGVAKNRVENDGVVPDKSINVELLKVSNFLHLTPRHVEKHCQVLQQFCTEWPEGECVFEGREWNVGVQDCFFP